MTKPKPGAKHGGYRPLAGAPKGELRVDESSPLMRGLRDAVVELGQPSTYEIEHRTGVAARTIGNALLHGRTPAAVRSIERILAGLGYTIAVVRIPTLDK